MPAPWLPEPMPPLGLRLEHHAALPPTGSDNALAIGRRWLMLQGDSPGYGDK